MSKFVDSLGVEWDLSLNIGLLAPLRRAGVNLSEFMTATQEEVAKKLASIIWGDPDLFGKLMWTICEEQAAELGIVEEKFAKRFDGPTISSATDAFLAALADFRHRPTVAEAIKKKLPQAMAALDRAILQEADKKLSTLSELVGNSLDSSGSIPES